MMNNLSKLGLSMMAALWLSGCSTLGGVGDAISSINPFDNSDSSEIGDNGDQTDRISICLLYTSPSPRDQRGSRMPSSA